MNKQSIQKLRLFLTGIQQRLKDNAEYFRGMTVLLKSGTRQYGAKLDLDNMEMLHMHLDGRTSRFLIDELGDELARQAEKYDSLVLTYEERGTVLVIEADQKNVKMKTTENTNTEDKIKSHAEVTQTGRREYYIKVGTADAVLKEIGVLGPNGKIKNDMVRKYNQIDHFVELIDSLLRELAETYGSITVLDCACGKSYLTFVLNYYIREVLKKPCHFIGLDYSDVVIAASQRMADHLGYHNMEFHKTDIRSYIADRPIHLVISLHACDTATDEAIALAVNNGVKSMVVVPCCHREMLNQYSYEPMKHIIKHGILKARMADILTDGMRSLLLEALGYEVSVVEYISPLETPKNLMIRARKARGPQKWAMEEYQKLKGMLNAAPALEKLIYRQPD